LRNQANVKHILSPVFIEFFFTVLRTAGGADPKRCVQVSRGDSALYSASSFVSSAKKKKKDEDPNFTTAAAGASIPGVNAHLR